MNNETKTYATIKVETFYTPDGKPTCSAGLCKDCNFLMLTRWGTQFICGYNNAELNRSSCNESLGFLVPDAGCPLHDIKE